MDEIDLKISILLTKNSRIPYRKMANEVELSVNAVHSRVQKMIDIGMIQEFYTKISLKAFKGVAVVSVEGESKYDNIKDLIDKLGENNRTFKVISASGNYVYVHGLLKDVTQMNEYIDSVQKEAELKNTEIFMPDMSDFEPLKEFEYSKLDYEIINSMHRNSRKPLSDVADEVGVSSKTVRRRINRMKEAEAIEFSIKSTPTKTNDFITFFEMEIKPGFDRKKVMNTINRKFSPNITSVFLASNAPMKLAANVWTKNLDEIHRLKEELRDEGYFDSIVSRIYYYGKEFDTWRDDILKEKIEG